MYQVNLGYEQGLVKLLNMPLHCHLPSGSEVKGDMRTDDSIDGDYPLLVIMELG